MTEQTVYRLATEFDKEYPHKPADQLATIAVRSLTAADRAAILTALLAAEIDALRRGRAREIERRAWEEATRPEREAREVSQREQRAEAAADKRERAKLRKEIEEDRARLWATDPEEYRRTYTIGGIIEAYEEKVRGDERSKVTAELLTVVFATGDGRKVTWGEATLEDHRKRIEMLTKHIKGNVQTIRLHEYAAQILRDTQASCLNNAKVAVA